MPTSRAGPPAPPPLLHLPSQLTLVLCLLSTWLRHMACTCKVQRFPVVANQLITIASGQYRTSDALSEARPAMLVLWLWCDPDLHEHPHSFRLSHAGACGPGCPGAAAGGSPPATTPDASSTWSPVEEQVCSSAHLLCITGCGMHSPSMQPRHDGKKDHVAALCVIILLLQIPPMHSAPVSAAITWALACSWWRCMCGCSTWVAWELTSLLLPSAGGRTRSTPFRRIANIHNRSVFTLCSRSVSAQNHMTKQSSCGAAAHAASIYLAD
jgi:hypothetical protein